MENNKGINRNDYKKIRKSKNEFPSIVAINLFIGTDIKYDEKEEVVNMCKAWDDHKKRGIQEGIQQGRLFEIYLSVQEGDYSAKRGAEKAEMSLDEFEKAMSKAGYKIPELV